MNKRMLGSRFLFPCVVGLMFSGSLAAGADELDYPFALETYEFEDQRQTLRMAYMDLAPSNGDVDAAPVALLLHGKNFCSAYWEETAQFLSGQGYRVIMPDQVGFCPLSQNSCRLDRI